MIGALSTSLVAEISTTSGLGNYVLNGAIPGGRKFSDAVVSGKSVFYTVSNGVKSETSQGIFTSPNLLSRDVLLESTDSNNKINWPVGGQRIIQLISQPKGEFGRLTGMEINPVVDSFGTPTGLGISVVGDYQAGTSNFSVNTIVTLPDTLQIYYIIGDANGNVSITADEPLPVYPKISNSIPVLLAKITPISIGTFHDQGGIGDGIQTVFSGTTEKNLIPGSVTIWAGPSVSGSDDGSGNITANADVTSGSVDYINGSFTITFVSPPAYGISITPYYDYKVTKVHKSWIIKYPVINNLFALHRKFDFDSGRYQIGGKDVKVGLLDSIPSTSLRNLLTSVPFGLDGISGSLYRIQSSRHEYTRFYLQDGGFYIAAASEGSSLVASDDGSGNVVLSGFPTGNYLDGTTCEGTLSDSTVLGPFTLTEFQQLASAEVPSVAYTGQTVNVITGGGLRDLKFTHGLIDSGTTLSCFGINESGTSNLSAIFQNMIIEDVSMTCSFPDTLHGQTGDYGVQAAAPLVIKRASIKNLSTGIWPGHLVDMDQCDISNIGLADGSHGNGIFFDSGVENIRAIGGKLGWSKIRRTRLSTPPPKSPRYNQGVTTAAISFQTDGAASVTITDVVIEECFIDGWTLWFAFNSNSPGGMDRVIIRNIWTTPSEFEGFRDGYHTRGFNFHSNLVGTNILIYNIMDSDTGEVFLDLNGKWDIVGGFLIKSPLPKFDFYGELIEVFSS